VLYTVHVFICVGTRVQHLKFEVILVHRIRKTFFLFVNHLNSILN